MTLAMLRLKVCANASTASSASDTSATVVPADYALRSEHQFGFVIVWAWAF